MCTGQDHINFCSVVHKILHIFKQLKSNMKWMYIQSYNEICFVSQELVPLLLHFNTVSYEPSINWWLFTKACTCVYWLVFEHWVNANGPIGYICLLTMACTMAQSCSASTDITRAWMLTISSYRFYLVPYPIRCIMFFPPLLCITASSCALGKCWWDRSVYQAK